VKASIRKALKGALKNDLIWFLCKPVIKIGELLKQSRTQNEWIGNQVHLKTILNEPIVKNGPFKGLKYPDYKSFGSAVFPKIIGSYEKEITPVIETILRSDYSVIFDIGAAEGYYAIGLALKMPGLTVFAYDIDMASRKYCRKMAEINNVSERVIIYGECTDETLRSFDFKNKALIISDCEGYEKHLFNKSNLSNLINCDILIEVHDCIDITISDYLESLFSGTHTLEKYKSMDDIEKAKTYLYPETADLDLQTRKEIFSEKRPGIMEWYWLQPKVNINYL